MADRIFDQIMTFSTLRGIPKYCRALSMRMYFDPNTQKAVISFRDPVNFPKGAWLFETKGPRVAVLRNNMLVMDDGGFGGRIFRSADEYRDQTGDREGWNLIKKF